jgi:ATP-binding cassette subfamily B protein
LIHKEKIENIEFKNLSIGNEINHILFHNLNLKLSKGALLAIIGPSGSGKSTLIRTVLGIQNSIKGNILINNEYADEKLFQKYSHDICFIPQEPFLFSGTIFDNIVYPEKIIAPTENEIKLAAKALSLSLLEKKDIFSDIKGLSGGEKQRLMFTRIFYRKPGLIIIDEGTSALDIGNELKIIENLKNHVENSITLVIAHRPAIKEYATDILDFSKTKTSQMLSPLSDASTKELL